MAPRPPRPTPPHTRDRKSGDGEGWFSRNKTIVIIVAIIAVVFIVAIIAIAVGVGVTEANKAKNKDDKSSAENKDDKSAEETSDESPTEAPGPEPDPDPHVPVPVHSCNTAYCPDIGGLCSEPRNGRRYFFRIMLGMYGESHGDPDIYDRMKTYCNNLGGGTLPEPRSKDDVDFIVDQMRLLSSWPPQHGLSINGLYQFEYRRGFYLGYRNLHTSRSDGKFTSQSPHLRPVDLKVLGYSYGGMICSTHGVKFFNKGHG